MDKKSFPEDDFSGLIQIDPPEKQSGSSEEEQAKISFQLIRS
jgi:hypothetical protein